MNKDHSGNEIRAWKQSMYDKKKIKKKPKKYNFCF